ANAPKTSNPSNPTPSSKPCSSATDARPPATLRPPPPNTARDVKPPAILSGNAMSSLHPETTTHLPAESWRRLLVVVAKLALSSDLDEILSIVVDAMRDCLHAERASVFQYDAPRAELIAARAHGVDPNLR